MRMRVVTLQEAQEWLVSQLSELIRVEPQEIDVRKPFAAYGLTSRETIGLSGDLCDWLGRDISPTVAYNFPDIASLAWYLANDVGDWASPDEGDRYHQNDFDPIAIISIGCRFPGAENPDAFWKLLREGIDAITEVPPERWDAQAFYDPDPATPGKMNTRWGGFLSGVEQFDADFFGISPREAEQIDPQQRLLLEVSWEALEHACLAPEQLRGTKTGVFVGISTHDYYQLQMDDMLGIDAYAGTGSALSIAANRLSYFYDFRGPSLAIDTACSSSLVAVHLACQSLKSGESDLALAGGVNLILSPQLNISLSHARMMAPDGRCKAFDDRADGYVRGEGCGIVVMKRLSQAIKDGDRVLAIVRGTAINQDGRSNGLTAPNGIAQEAVIHQALSSSRVSPADISYVEAHGTGTSLGDPIEFNTLKAILMKDRRPNQPCLLGSVKTNIGHLEAAAGIAGLIKIVLSLEYNEIPPVLHFKRLNPHISLEATTFLIPTEAHPWPVEQNPHRAGVSSFGFGGVNAHAVLERAIAPILTAEGPLRPHLLSTQSTQTEEAHLPPSSQVEPPDSILCLSAKSPQALQQLAGRYAQYLDEHPNLPLADLCYTANTGRAQFPHRLTALAHSNTELGQQLRAYSEGRATAGVFSGRVRSWQQPPIAFLCAGGGSQYLGMGRNLYEMHPLFRQVLDQCDQLLRGELERPLLKAIYPDAGDELLLDQMAYTQPALFALEYALAQVWRSYGVEPGAVMGHSTGEYVAACLAGVFSLEDGLKLVAARGRLMQGLPEDGAMAAVSASLKQVVPELSGYEKEIAVAAINSPNQVVISGARQAIQAVCERMGRVGIECQYLPIPHASHSPLVEPMMEEFEQLIRDLKFETPRLRMISNVTGEAVESGRELGGEYWSRHLREPVQFASGMESLKREGYEIFVEMGPSATLLGLGRSCLGEEGGVWVPSLRKERKDWEQLQESLGRLWGVGVEINWRKVAGEGRRKLVGLPNYPFQRRRYWPKSGESNKRRMGRAGAISNPGLEHPLLGYRLRSAVSNIQFENQLSLETVPYLRDHQVYDMVVFPATAYLEIALAGVTAVSVPNRSSLPKLEEVAIHKAMTISKDETRIVQLILTTEQLGTGSFQIFSLQDIEEANSASWTLHASGKFRALYDTLMFDHNALAQAQARCQQEVDRDAYYQWLSEYGLNYGISFRGIERLWRREGEAVAQIQLPESLITQAAKYRMHPVLLDACFQTIAAAWRDPEDQMQKADIYLPTGIESFQCYRLAGTRIWSYAHLQQSEMVNSRALTGNVRLLDQSGQVVAEVTGLRLERTSRQALLRIGQHRQEAFANWLYEISWQPKLHLVSSAGWNQRQANGHESWLIFADQSGVGASLAKLLEERGETCIFVLPSTVDTHSAQSCYRVNLAQPEELDWVLSEVRRKDQSPLRGVIHLWSLDVAAPEELNSSALIQAQMLSCGSVLHLTQALARVGLERPPRLWLVTRGALAVGADTRSLSVAQTPVWGMGRVIALEHPELCCVTVDLDSTSDVDEAQLLFEEICSQEGEDQIAFRDGLRYVARLVTHVKSEELVESNSGFAADQPIQLQISARGILDNLTLQPLRRRQPGVGEVEIEVYASGLNFRDVMVALGLRPGDLSPLGGECAGRIVALGEGVEGLRLGDEVIAIATGSFSTFVTTSAHLVAPKPPGLTFIEAATIPIAFLTAHYALNYQAKLSVGDRVLIHAAAGGVGLAAVQLAQRAGAEIFATAGNEEKRELLRSLGIRHVMNSRSLNFVDEVMTITEGLGIDVALNSLNDKFIPASLSVMGSRGRFLEIGKRDILDHHQVAKLKSDVSYFVIDLLELCQQHPASIHPMLLELIAEFEAGHLKPLPFQTFPLQEAKRAFRCMAQAKHVGKIVIIQEKAKRGQPQTTSRTRFAARADSSYLITGGLGALGLHMAKWLIEHGARNLLLVSRHAAREEAARRLYMLEAAGANVVVVQADVANAEQLAAALSQASAGMPPLRGVIHAAGVLSDGLLSQQKWERFTEVMSAKIAGGWNLHRYLEGQELDFFVMCSSAAAVLGSPGQGNYAASNAFLDGLAMYRRGRGETGVSINWGPWAGDGLAAGTGERRWAELGVKLIEPEQGVELLGEVLERGSAQLVVMGADWKQMAAQYGSSVQALLRELTVVSGKEAERAERRDRFREMLTRLSEVGPQERWEQLVSYLQQEVAAILGLDNPRSIDTQRHMNELGFDSLMALELRNTLGSILGITLPATLIFDHPSIESLARYLGEEVLALALPTEARAERAEDTDRDGLTAILARLDQLSEIEAESLLGQELLNREL